tara:strand:- start:1102 stop:1548 length:447 start_codon:yes stop_codon:yes gene_type:complete
MAKELPFFKFNVSEWLTGDISYESFEIQGLFINVCCEYWNRGNKLTIQEAKKRTKTDKKIDYLIENNFIYKKRNEISINFLDEERNEIRVKSLKLSEAGRKGGLRQAQARLKHKEIEVEVDIEVDKDKEIDKNKIEHWNKDLPTGIKN